MAKRAFVFLILLTSVVEADVWRQTNWSGGAGQQIWSDTTRYLSGNNINGWRVSGNVILNAPKFPMVTLTGDIGNWPASFAEDSAGNIYTDLFWPFYK